MFVHVDARIFEKRPLLAVALGAVAFCFCLFGIWMMLEQNRMFGKEPQLVEVDQAVPPPPHFDIGPWVHLRGALEMHCGEAVQMRRTPPESWVFGKVESSFLPAFNLSRDRFFLIEFDGDVNCQSMPKAALIGILIPVNPQLRATLSGEGLVFPPTQVPPILLETNWGPARVRRYLFFLFIIACICMWMMKRYWRKHGLAKNTKHAYAAAGMSILNPFKN